MKFFRAKETVTQNIAFMALIAAINIIISVVAAFTPVFSIFLVLILPLTSTLIALFCKARYFPIYAVATIGLSLVATIWNMETTIFYVLPSILTGLVFGILTKLKIHPVWSIFGASILQAGLTFAFIPLINFLFGTDIINIFRTVFNAKDQSWFDVIVPMVIYAISLIQVFLSYFIVSNEIKKFGFEQCKELKHPWIYAIIGIVSGASVIGFYFLSLPVAYLMMLICFYFAGFEIICLVENKYWRTLIVDGAFLLINIFVFALAYQYMKQDSQMLLITLTPLCISLLSLAVYFLQKQKE